MCPLAIPRSGRRCRLFFLVSFEDRRPSSLEFFWSGSIERMRACRTRRSGIALHLRGGRFLLFFLIKGLWKHKECQQEVHKRARDSDPKHGGDDFLALGDVPQAEGMLNEPSTDGRSDGQAEVEDALEPAEDTRT